MSGPATLPETVSLLTDPGDYLLRPTRFKAPRLVVDLPDAGVKAAKPDREFGCLMAPIPQPLLKEIQDWVIENLRDEHLGADGRELDPHVTVKFGFTDDGEETQERLRAMLLRHGPVQLILGSKLSTFPEGKDGVPLKIDVISPQLHQLNFAVTAEFPTETKHPTYVPHLTLGYLRPGAERFYVGMQPPFLGRVAIVDRLRFGLKKRDAAPVEMPLTSRGVLASLFKPSTKSSPGASGTVRVYRGMSQSEFSRFRASRTLVQNPGNIGNSISRDMSTARYYASERRQDEPGVLVSFLIPVDALIHDDLSKDDFAVKRPTVVSDLQVIESHVKGMRPESKAWVTMGGGECEEGDHCGGTPVDLDSEGNIRKGPEGTVGKKPSELKDEKPKERKVGSPKVGKSPIGNKAPKKAETIKVTNPSPPPFLNKHFRSAWAMTDGRAKKAVERYTSHDYKQINDAMRKCPPDFSCLEGDVKDAVNKIEHALDMAEPFPEPVTTYRGLSFKDEDSLNSLMSAIETAEREGKPFSMPSITSTSINAGYVLSSWGGRKSGVVFQIKAKTGLYVESISVNPEEMEIIQSSKTKYKVTRVADTEFDMKGVGEEDLTTRVVYLEEV